VLERARGLLEKSVAYDYVFRAHQHPTAADNRLQARGTITFAGAGAHAEPLPKFAPEQLGDCIDCTICVQVCPTGIDIRNGLQYECIACGACIDACDDVMGKMGYPNGLIRYSTQNAIDGKNTRVMRPRVWVYGGILLALVSSWAWGVTHRSDLIVEVLRDRNALYSESADGSIENGYTLKIINKDQLTHRYTISLEGAASGMTLAEDVRQVEVAAEQVLSLPVVVSAPAGTHGRQPLRFQVERSDGQSSKQVDSSFFGPSP
jgi:cytochrome c oxidase accessory protein FixG